MVTSGYFKETIVKNQKIIKLFFIILLLKLICSHSFAYLNTTFFKLEIKDFDELSQNELFFAVVVFSPIIETLFCQFFLYRLLIQLGIKNELILIILMAFVFSQFHWYHWLYVVATFLGGLLLNYFYLSIYKIKNEFIAFLWTIALHSSFNLYGFLVNKL